MKRWMVILLAASFVVACGKKKGNDAGPNPIDQAMEPMFEAEGLEMVDASNRELCRRLYADLLGRLPTADEVAQDCAGRNVRQIVKDFQRRDEYLLVAERNWRDILNTNDVNGDWRYLQQLYADVDDMYRGKLSYEEFAIRVLMNPGFLLQDINPVERAGLAFEAFLGRPATDAEMNDLAAVFRPWLPTQTQDPDFTYTYRIDGGIAPVLCEPLSDCSSTLLGGGELDFGTQTAFEVIPYADLTADQLEILRTPGEMFTGAPFFYEAAADEILNRLLGWSDGGRFPREPGVVLPEVRQIVADELRNTGSYAQAERVVLTSILYRGAAEVEPDGFGDDPDAPEPPVWSTGPVKYTQTEVLLNTAANLTVDLGTCDPRYTDLFSGYFQIIEAYNGGTIDQNQARDDIAHLADLQGIRMELTDYDGQQPIAYPDTTYTYVARLIGGCPGFQNPRFDGRAGLSYSFSQETLAELLCTIPDNLVGEDTSVGGVLTHQMRLLYGRDPSAEEITDFESAFDDCGAGEDCSTTGMANGVCVALTGANEMLFY